MKTNNPIVGVNFTRIDKPLCEYVDFLSTKIEVVQEKGRKPFKGVKK